MRVYLEKQAIYVYTVCLAVYVVFTMMFYHWHFTVYNYIVFFISCFLVIIGYSDLKKRGLTPYSLFLIVFFGVMAMNNLNIGKIQLEKRITDLYFYFFGPCIFAFILYSERLETIINNKISYRANSYYTHSEDNDKILRCIITLLWIIHIILQIYIYQRTGIRFFSSLWDYSQGNEFVVPGISGISNALMWMCLLFVPIMKREMSILISISSIVIPLLDASRGTLMRVLVMLLFTSLYRKKEQVTLEVNKKEKIFLSCCIVFIGIGFIIFGFYRNYMRGSRIDNMTVMLDSNVDNMAINWIYGYTCINFDVLKNMYENIEPSNKIELLFSPLIRLIGGSSAVMQHRQSVFYSGINGLNASTFLGPFVQELGYLYFLDVILSALILKLLYAISLKCQFKGGVIMIFVSVFFTFYDNFYLTSSVFYAIIGGIVLCAVFNNSRIRFIIHHGMQKRQYKT